MLAVRCPSHEVAQTRKDGGVAAGIGARAEHGVKFTVIIEFELHAHACGRLSRAIEHLHRGTRRLGIVGGDVDFRIARRAGDYVFRPVVAAEYFRVHQHAARGRLVEPAEIKHRLRLACAEEVPASVHVDLYPGVVVVGMRPARRIYLPRGNTHGAERGHSEGTLFAAASRGGAHRGEGRGSAGIGRFVSHIFVAPMVHLQSSLAHRQSLHAILELFVARRAKRVEGFIVHAHGQHEVPPFPFGHVLAPGHLAAGAQGAGRLRGVVFGRVVRHVGARHIGIKESECTAFVLILGQCQSLRGVLATAFGIAGLEVGLRLLVGILALLHGSSLGGAFGKCRLCRKRSGGEQNNREEFHKYRV